MVFGELFGAFSGQLVDPGVPDMENMRRSRPDDDCAERADVPFVSLIRVLASSGLCMQPGIGRGNDALRGRFDGPGIRRAVIVGQEALYGSMAGDPADLAAADPVGYHNGDAL